MLKREGGGKVGGGGAKGQNGYPQNVDKKKRYFF